MERAHRVGTGATGGIENLHAINRRYECGRLGGGKRRNIASGASDKKGVQIRPETGATKTGGAETLFKIGEE